MNKRKQQVNTMGLNPAFIKTPTGQAILKAKQKKYKKEYQELQSSVVKSIA